MAALQIVNDLGLVPPSMAGKSATALLEAQPEVQAQQQDNIPHENRVAIPIPAEGSLQFPADLQTEFVFDLPIGYVDGMGQRHRHGVMRLARTTDEIEPMSDPRVQANPAYATVIILSRVILSLGELPDVSPVTIEGMFAGDLNYLQNFYRHINQITE